MNCKSENIFLTGNHINLRRPIEQDALGDWHGWFNDQEVALFTGWWKPNTPERQVEYLRAIEKSNDILVLIIETKNQKKPIGVVSLSKINWLHRIADIALVIGDREARAKAVFGLEALTLMIRHAFLRLNLENLRGGFVSGQEASNWMLKALKFEQVGRYESVYKIDNVNYDHVLVQLKASEWKQRNIN